MITALEARITSKYGPLGANDEFERILSQIKTDAESGNSETIVDVLTDIQVEMLIELGYAIFNHKRFTEPTGKFLISWFSDPKTSFSV